MSIQQHKVSIDQERDALVERLNQSLLGMMEVRTVYIGDRLGLYQALADGGWLTSTGLASRTDTHERYVREWLEQQTVAGILEVEEANAEATARRFRIPAGHIEVLVDRDSVNYVPADVRACVGASQPLAAVLEAFRTGGGVPFSEYGADAREGMADMKRVLFLTVLGNEWLPAIHDVHARLLGDPPARVADIGCGAGWSSIGIAQTYPKVHVDGHDLDETSVELARANAIEAGLEDRVAFHVQDASAAALAGCYDLVIAIACIHDMTDPVGALRTMRRLAGEAGAVVVEEPRVGDAFAAEGYESERMLYSISLLHCLPMSMADQPSAAIGTLMRVGTFRRFASEAGFRSVEILPIEDPGRRFYRLHS